MSDDRIETALRQGPPDEPSYMAQLTHADFHRHVHAGRGSNGAFRLLAGIGEAAAAAGLVVALVGILLIRSGTIDVGTSPSSRLTDVQARGVIRIAVRPDRPQVTTPGGARSGFDVDVATEIGRRLGLRVELVFTSVDAMLAGTGDWDIALPSSAVEHGRFATTSPYYDWPVRLIVPAGSAATGPSDLANTTICVVTGSGGEAWLDGRFNGVSVTPVAVPPTPSVVQRVSADDACAAQVTAGTSAAFVTSAWTDADLAARPDLAPLGGPVLTEARPVIAVLGDTDPAGLIAEVDRTVAAMRSDGTLANFSRNRFGGLDLSQPTAP